MKHGIYLCGDCLKCRDPNIYCKHRSACPIRFIEKHEQRPDGRENPTAAPPDSPSPPAARG
jgi:hypothetical protein